MSLISEFRQALVAEIEEQKRKGTARWDVRAGRLVEVRGPLFVYCFILDDPTLAGTFTIVYRLVHHCLPSCLLSCLPSCSHLVHRPVHPSSSFERLASVLEKAKPIKKGISEPQLARETTETKAVDRSSISTSDTFVYLRRPPAATTTGIADRV